MLCGLAVTGAYYLVARLTFPGDAAEWPDYDVYYFAHKRVILAGVIGCNLAAQVAQLMLGHNPISGLWDLVAVLCFYPFLLAAVWAESKTTNIFLLAFVLAQYPLLSFIDLIDASKIG
jgi:hypothetical protein